VVLLASSYTSRLLGERGLSALQRLMGMILTVISVQMFLTGLETYFQRG
jgi:multiple antibiotic resistance protein